MKIEALEQLNGDPAYMVTYHEDSEVFLQEVVRQYGENPVNLSTPTYEWWREAPPPNDVLLEDTHRRFLRSAPGIRGAFPVTVTRCQ